MEVFSHLLPSGCQRPEPLLIPWRGCLEGVIDAFDDYPLQKGFSLSVDKVIVAENGKYDDVTSLLQTWMFLHMLTMMVDRAGGILDPDILIRRDENGLSRVNLLYASQLIQNWGIRIEKQRKKPTWSTELYFYVRTLTLAHRNAKYLDFEDPANPSFTQQRARVLLSIKSCIRAFLRELTFIGISHKSLFTESLIAIEICDYTSPSAALAKQFLISSGWCPVHAQRLIEEEEIEQLYIAAAVRSNLQHQMDHTRCSSANGCVAHNIDPATFRQTHARRNCDCPLVAPDMATVRSILREGNIPVVEVRRDGDGRYKLEAKASEANTSYTAVSHVWSDGLANPQRNGVFYCQLAKLEDDLRSILDRYDEPTHYPEQRSQAVMNMFRLPTLSSHHVEDVITIWIDAFCVPCSDPQDQENPKELQEKAVQLMPLTYAGASHVLVIDNSMEFVNHSTIGRNRYSMTIHSEMTAWLKFSPWMTRCWTLQEGALARNLLVRCASLPIQVIMKQLSLTTLVSFNAVMKQLLARDTSYKDDLHKILANICGLECSELSKLSAPARARAFLHWNAPRFPFSLLLQKSHREANDVRPDWWVPTFDTTLHFVDEQRKRLINASLQNSSSGSWTSTPNSYLLQYEAVLHDQGIVFVPRNLGYTPVECDQQYPAKFCIRIGSDLIWIRLDLNPSSFIASSGSMVEARTLLVLPHPLEVLSASGLVGRGFCITISGHRHNIPIPKPLQLYGQPESWTVIPATFQSALTCGLVTKFTNPEYSACPLVDIDIVDPYIHICLEMDVASWPTISSSRPAKDFAIFGFHWDIVLAQIFGLSAIAGAVCFIYSAQPLMILLGTMALTIIWLWYCRPLYLQKKVHRLWAQNFRDNMHRGRIRSRVLYNMWSGSLEISYMLLPWLDQSSASQQLHQFQRS